LDGRPAKDSPMTYDEIQRQYDEVIAPHYDLDPLAVTGRSLDRALAQLKDVGCLLGVLPTMDVLDVGIGTGRFFGLLRQESDREIRPHGLDVSRQMIELAMTRIPDLIAEVDDGANIAVHFDGTLFDLVCTHFVTGFVPLAHIAPEIFSKLKPGGYWSFVGATSQAFSKLQEVSHSRLVKLLLGGKGPKLNDLKTPTDQSHSLEICDIQTFLPELLFRNFDEFMAFAWKGGWLTPFIEDVGIHKASRLIQFALNQFVFPVMDHHQIVIALVRKHLIEC
jgi:SAM-dependent methyltransferase